MDFQTESTLFSNTTQLPPKFPKKKKVYPDDSSLVSLATFPKESVAITSPTITQPKEI